MADPTLQNGMTPGGTDKNGMAVASLVLGIIASVLAIVSIIVAQTDWYQTTVTQQLIDTFGDQYADMLN